MESAGSPWGHFSRRSFLKKALVVPFAAPVIVSFTMDSVSAHPTARHHYPNQHHPYHHHKPHDLTLPHISGRPAEGNTLTAHHGEWSHHPTHYHYQWNRYRHRPHHGTADGSASNKHRIPGATGRTYNVGKHDVGHWLSVTVRGINSAGAGDPATSAAVHAREASHKPRNDRGFTG
jgi:hypothetical protein